MFRRLFRIVSLFLLVKVEALLWALSLWRFIASSNTDPVLCCSCAWCWGCPTTARCCSPPTTSSSSCSGTPVTATRSRRSEARSTSLARSLSRSGHNHYQDHCQDHCQGVKISVKFMVKIIVKISVQIIVILAKKWSKD